MLFYYPSCNYTRFSPEGSKRIKEYLSKKYEIKIQGCCRPGHKELAADDTAITICQSCSIICRENVPQAKEISIWEVMDKDQEFKWPDLKGERITIQDCWRAKGKEELYKAVRSIMRKMNIEIVELEDNYDKTEFCGVFRYNEMIPANKKIAPKFFVDYMEDKLDIHNEEQQQKLMEDNCKKYTTDRVICYCNACLRGVLQGGGNGIHLMDLIMGVVK